MSSSPSPFLLRTWTEWTNPLRKTQRNRVGHGCCRELPAGLLRTTKRLFEFSSKQHLSSSVYSSLSSAETTPGCVWLKRLRGLCEPSKWPSHLKMLKQSVSLCKLLISARAKAGRARDTTPLPKHQPAEGSRNHKGPRGRIINRHKPRQCHTVSGQAKTPFLLAGFSLKKTDTNEQRRKKPVRMRLVFYARRGNRGWEEPSRKHDIRCNHSTRTSRVRCEAPLLKLLVLWFSPQPFCNSGWNNRVVENHFKWSREKFSLFKHPFFEVIKEGNRLAFWETRLNTNSDVKKWQFEILGGVMYYNYSLAEQQPGAVTSWDLDIAVRLPGNQHKRCRDKSTVVRQQKLPPKPQTIIYHRFVGEQQDFYMSRRASEKKKKKTHKKVWAQNNHLQLNK